MQLTKRLQLIYWWSRLSSWKSFMILWKKNIYICFVQDINNNNLPLLFAVIIIVDIFWISGSPLKTNSKTKYIFARLILLIRKQFFKTTSTKPVFPGKEKLMFHFSAFLKIYFFTICYILWLLVGQLPFPFIWSL